MNTRLIKLQRVELNDFAHSKRLHYKQLSQRKTCVIITGFRCVCDLVTIFQLLL